MKSEEEQGAGQGNLIRLLDNRTVAQIAAGEVIERPVSVVKELVENSLDANSRQIDLEIEAGGLTLIRVADDGWGIAAEDLSLAVKRHATSKIRSAEDLEKIGTLGFRGEALPAIGAVSHLEIISRTSNAKHATKIISEFGVCSALQTAGAPPGTIVVVRRLFENVPVRRKFQPNHKTEARNILNMVEKFAISHPGVAFKLKSSGKRQFLSSGNGSVRDAAAAVFGWKIAERLTSVKTEGITILASNTPDVSFAHRAAQIFIVNGRIIKSSLLEKIVDAYYSERLAARRQPLVILHLELNPEDLDVNVHPAKIEVKFRDDETIRRRVTETLEQMQWPLPNGRNYLIFENPTVVLQPDIIKEESGGSYGDFNPDNSERKFSESKLFDTKCPKSNNANLSTMSIIGQTWNSYIILSSEEAIYMLDQHAAHERIIYEEILGSKGTELNVPSQTLALPEIITLKRDEYQIFSDNALLLREAGFIIEDFGDNSIIVRGVPQGMTESVNTAFKDAIYCIMKMPYMIDALEKRNRIAALAACKQAVKAGDVLGKQEIRTLLEKLENTKKPFSCPHGRPIIFMLKRSYIDKQFNR